MTSIVIEEVVGGLRNMVKGIRVVYYRRKWSSSFDPGGIGGWVAGFVNTDTDRNKGQLRRINSV